MRQYWRNANEAEPMSRRRSAAEQSGQAFGPGRNGPLAFGRSLFPADAVAQSVSPCAVSEDIGPRADEGLGAAFRSSKRTLRRAVDGLDWRRRHSRSSHADVSELRGRRCLCTASGPQLRGRRSRCDRSATPSGAKAAVQMNEASKDIVTTDPGFAELRAQHRGSGAMKLQDLEHALVNPRPCSGRRTRWSSIQICRWIASANLRRWAWDEYLLQLASDEAMPEGRKSSRLDESNPHS